ncbi:type II toxin-antitoxin system RelE/ParE family toxin [Salinisphaera sp. P385]|uniref:Type II toxin-antitoxin system RelE/ParE family toxin n=1 Tax=Spectribacter acetivorans TaxID=3075603 RepID=A0ABU3B622_9GAMM|nr:type II toxin-antitoxin system RelE/ParE family toxin [Salinisphaera sp. P385]MDT0617892.1 type II toxin-antitoxin system RelE/ParE family toxin [Salinisphaera sp. P385]
MNYTLHPEAAFEHEEQVAYYETSSRGLGQRYHDAFRAAVTQACEHPQRHKLIAAPDLRQTPIHGFPHTLIFREHGDGIQVLAVAHHRRRPGYWAPRL